MAAARTQAETDIRPEPTLLETELDSIALTLTQMKLRLSRRPTLEHLTDLERAELDSALARVETRVHEVGDLIRRPVEMAVH